jgi:hypothetical protein
MAMAMAMANEGVRMRGSIAIAGGISVCAS